MSKERNVGKVIVELEPDDHAGMLGLAERNGRTLSEEMRHAVKRHLRRPPEVRVIEPPLEDATVERTAGDKPKRGRPPKANAPTAEPKKRGRPPKPKPA